MKVEFCESVVHVYRLLIGLSKTRGLAYSAIRSERGFCGTCGPHVGGEQRYRRLLDRSAPLLFPAPNQESSSVYHVLLMLWAQIWLSHVFLSPVNPYSMSVITPDIRAQGQTNKRFCTDSHVASWNYMLKRYRIIQESCDARRVLGKCRWRTEWPSCALSWMMMMMTVC